MYILHDNTTLVLFSGEVDLSVRKLKIAVFGKFSAEHNMKKTSCDNSNET